MVWDQHKQVGENYSIVSTGFYGAAVLLLFYFLEKPAEGTFFSRRSSGASMLLLGNDDHGAFHRAIFGADSRRFADFYSRLDNNFIFFFF
jgi:hypothetical protein